jgi:FkbM family methyltransferase
VKFKARCQKGAVRLRGVVSGLLLKTLRFYPLKSGCGTIANSRVMRTLIYTPSSKVTTITKDGSRLIVRADDYVGRAAVLFGDLDPKLSWVVDRVLRPGDNVLDIGANWGLVTMRAANRVGSGGRVHAIEPQRALIACGERSAMLNHYTNVTFHALAMSDASGTMKLCVPDVNSGAASLSHTLADFSGHDENVPVQETSAFLESLDIGRWRLWKIDVEGHEAAVLRGAVGYLGTPRRPDVIVFEEHGRPAVRSESVILLASLGYEIFVMPRAIFRHHLLPLNPELNVGHDFIAIEKAARLDVGRALRIREAVHSL